MAKPFLKWAGGKTQLISQIAKELPEVVLQEPFVYVEPFVGGGAMLFWMLEQFPNMKGAVINDINTDLINCYKSIKNQVENLIATLNDFEQQYLAFPVQSEHRKEFYYSQRTLFNSRSSDLIEQSALFIFLNRTCFNGLYRVNKKNEFNVPQGSYKNPQICNADNLRAVSRLLEKVSILNGDFEDTLAEVGEKTFFYFDPPYKPLDATSSFNNYTQIDFDDKEQIRLKEFCEKLDRLGHKWLLSNSDLKGKNPLDNFFDDLYADFNIFRVKARRSINSNPKKRGELTELLIKN